MQRVIKRCQAMQACNVLYKMMIASNDMDICKEMYQFRKKTMKYYYFCVENEDEFMQYWKENKHIIIRDRFNDSIVAYASIKEGNKNKYNRKNEINNGYVDQSLSSSLIAVSPYVAKKFYQSSYTFSETTKASINKMKRGFIYTMIGV